MYKFLFLLCSFSCVHLCYGQSLDGLYIASELRTHRVDTLGQINFSSGNYKNYWFFYVRVFIRGEQISVRKRYAYTDSLGNKFYADSVTHEFWYVGKLVKVEDRFIAKIKLVNQPVLHPGKQGQPEMAEAKEPTRGARMVEHGMEHTYQTKRFHDGMYPVPKELVQQDLIIRPDTGGIWINNNYCRKAN